MLTVPKLAHQSQHRRQNTLENLLLNSFNPQPKNNISNIRSDRIIQVEM